jgi:hypothetical protein
MIKAIGKRGARSSGVTDWPVPGCRTGGRGSGKSGRMLYQEVGISCSSRINFVLSIFPPYILVFRLVFSPSKRGHRCHKVDILSTTLIFSATLFLVQSLSQT